MEGNPGQRRLPENEPKPKAAPRGWRAPNNLHGEARREWERLVGPLQACGILTVIDRDVLATYCTIYGLQIEAEMMIRREGRMVLTPNGLKVPNPWLTVFRQMVERKKAYLLELGLTPAARARMGAAMAEPRKPTDSGDDSPEAQHAGEFGNLIGQQKH